MKARGLLLCALAVLLAASWSWSDTTVDLGGSIANTTGAQSSGSPELLQTDRALLWLRLDGPNTVFLLRGLYSLSIDGQTPPKHVLDVERLRLTTTVRGDGAPLSRFEFSLGRRMVTDFTGYVVGQTLDGFGLTVGYPFASVTASLGTSFLPNKNNAPVVMSRADAADLGNDAVVFGAPRVVGLLEVVFPNVLRQRLTLSLAMQEDLRGLLFSPAVADLFAGRAALIEEGRPDLVPSGSGLLDTQYSSVGLRGNISGGLFYNAFFALGTGRTLSYVTEEGSAQGSYLYTPILSGLGGVGLNLYAERVLGSVVGLRFVLSTGDGWDERSSPVESSLTANPNLFVPVTGRPLSLVFAPTLGNMALVEASYQLRPFVGLGSAVLGQLQLGATALLFLRPSAGPISVSVSNTASSAAYLGSELDLSVSFRPFSDLAVRADGGLFLPNSGLDGPFAGESLRWRAQLTGSFSF